MLFTGKTDIKFFIFESNTRYVPHVQRLGIY